jgi:hypothetical protein
MTYRQLNRDRLAYLLAWGTLPGELKSFITDNRKLLLLTGVKAQNTPAKLMQQAELVSRLPEHAHKIIERYIKTHIAVDATVHPDDIVTSFSDAEKDGADPIATEEIERLSRAALALLYREDCPDTLLAFMRTSIANGKASIKSSPFSEGDSATPKQDRAAALEETTQSLSPDAIQGFIRAVIAYSSGDQSSFHEAMETVPENSKLRIILKELNGAGSLPGSRGITSIPVLKASLDDVNVSDAEVLGVCSVHQAERCFIDVIGILMHGIYVTLDKDRARILLPPRGGLIGFANTPNLKLPKKGEVGLWHVEELTTDKQIRWKICPPVRTVYEMHRLDFASKEYDSVRMSLQEFRPTSLNKPLFLLEDGVIIKPRSEIRDFAKERFEEPFDAWTSLHALKWKSRSFIVAPLPAPDFSYDCSNLEDSLGRIFELELIQQSSLPKLSRAQVHEISEALRACNELDIARITELQNRLGKLLDTQEQVSKIFHLVVGHPSIQEQIAAAKIAAESSLRTDKAALVTEIAFLAKQRTALEKEFEERKREEVKLPSQVADAVRQRFEEATADGIGLLAETAFFKAIAQPSAVEIKNKGEGDQEHVTALKWKSIPRASISVPEIFRTFGVSKGQSVRLEKALHIATSCGFAVAFKGIGASLAATKYASSISKVTVACIDIGVGLTENGTLISKLLQPEQADVLLLRRFNHSPVEIYGPQLIDTITDRFINPDQRLTPVVVLSFSDGVGALPPPIELMKVSFIIDLDQSPKDIDLSADQLFELAIANVVPGGVPAWRVSLKRITDVLRKLDADEQTSLMPLFHAGLVESLQQ